MSNAVSSSSIVVILSTPRTTGSSPSPASYTLARLVRVWILHGSVTTLRTNVVNIVIGIIFNYQNARVAGITWTAIPYFSISLSLNVLLTLMIVIRLILYARNTHTAMGLNGIGGLCKAIVTMLVESCALYAVSSLLVIGPWSANINPITNFFLAVLPEIQVRAFTRLRSSNRLSNATTGLG